MELTTARVALPARLDPPSVVALADALDRALASPARVVVLTGASANVFCHGLAIDAADDGASATDTFAALFARLHASPKPLLTECSWSRTRPRPCPTPRQPGAPPRWRRRRTATPAPAGLLR